MNLRRATVVFVALSSFFLAFALSAAPALHEHVHSDAGHAQHECAITLIQSGIEAHDAPVILTCAQPAHHFATIPALHSVWVPALFQGACVFEHAPPALS